MRAPENNFVEINFDNRVKIEALANKKITIKQIGSMTTKYGKKFFAVTSTDEWFYLTDTLEHLTKIETPFVCTISKTESKNGNAYWTSDKKPVSTNKHITDLVGETIEIVFMETINTKYGERIRLTYWNHEDQNDTNEYHVLTNWTYLYDWVLEQLIGQMEDLQNDPLVVKVVEKKSKKGNVYISYENI